MVLKTEFASASLDLRVAILLVAFGIISLVVTCTVSTVV
jgi:hypothetical protein